jgi:hypothetical protein
MLKAFLTLCLTMLLLTITYGQQNEGNQEKVVFKSNTEFSMQLETALSSDKNKVGDDVNFVLTEEINSDGNKLEKGSIVYGRIVNIQKISEKNDTAKICIMFDFIKKGDQFISIVAAITEINPNTEAIKFAASPTFSGGTTLSLKGKEIQLDKGRIFHVKLIKDVTAE